MMVMPYTSVREALAAIDAHKGPAESFTLPLANSMLNGDGAAMAVITDRILARGWEPDGYEAGPNCKVYRYKSAGW